MLAHGESFFSRDRSTANVIAPRTEMLRCTKGLTFLVARLRPTWARPMQILQPGQLCCARVCISCAVAGSRPVEAVLRKASFRSQCGSAVCAQFGGESDRCGCAPSRRTPFSTGSKNTLAGLRATNCRIIPPGWFSPHPVWSPLLGRAALSIRGRRPVLCSRNPRYRRRDRSQRC